MNKLLLACTALAVLAAPAAAAPDVYTGNEVGEMMDSERIGHIVKFIPTLAVPMFGQAQAVTFKSQNAKVTCAVTLEEYVGFAENYLAYRDIAYLVDPANPGLGCKSVTLSAGAL